jgi:hypothetical protein
MNDEVKAEGKDNDAGTQGLVIVMKGLVEAERRRLQQERMTRETGDWTAWDEAWSKSGVGGFA